MEDSTDLTKLDVKVTLKLLRKRGPSAKIFKKNDILSFGNKYTRFIYYWESICLLFRNNKFKIVLWNVLISIIGSKLPNSEWIYSLLLLDIIHRYQILQNIIKAVTYNWRQLVMTALLGFVLMFIFSAYAFFFIDDTYNLAGGENFCTTMLQCYFSTIDNVKSSNFINF